MKVLMINKFLHPNGGSETYIFRLAEQLQFMGHQVQFFGMDHKKRIVGNDVDAYTSNMDFHEGSIFSKLSYLVRTIYSREARKKLRLVLDDFQPDVCHLNNFNYQLTPSIILEIRQWEKETGASCKIIYTAHDYQLICPNHMCLNPVRHQICEKCLGGHFYHCVSGRCIHGSAVKSLLGCLEGYFWKWAGIYKQLDTIICPSRFMKKKLDTNPIFAEKTVAMHNFVDPKEEKPVQKRDYVLYFGRYSFEKGIDTLVSAAKELPQIPFIFAGTGPLEHKLNAIPNITNVGFQTGEALETLIREARFTIYPSEWYENCPFSVMESQLYSTLVLGADVGGIPELIQVGKTGELFKSGDKKQLIQKITSLWNRVHQMDSCVQTCGDGYFDNLEEYCTNLLRIYRQ